MTDVGVAVTNLRVVCKLSRAVCKIIACVQRSRIQLSQKFSRDSKKLLLVRTLRVAGYAKDAIVDACHRTNDGQEHKIIWRAGPEQDKISTYVSQRAESKAATI